MVAGLECTRDLAVEARGQPDQALRVARQVFPVDARLVVVAVEMRVRDEAAQVLVAAPVLGQQDQVVRLVVALALAVRHRTAGGGRLPSRDGVYGGGAARLVERGGPL